MKSKQKLCLMQSCLFFITAIMSSILPAWANQNFFPIAFDTEKKSETEQQIIGTSLKQLQEPSNSIGFTNMKPVSTIRMKPFSTIKTKPFESIKIKSAENEHTQATFKFNSINDNNVIELSKSQPVETKSTVFFIPNTDTSTTLPESDVDNTQNVQLSVTKVDPQPFISQAEEDKNVYITQPQAFEDTTSTKQGYQLSLPDVVRVVMNWHPVIKRSINEVSRSEEAISEAKAGYFPSLKASVQSGFEQNAYSNKNELEHNLVVSLTQNIYDFGKTSSNVSLAQATLHHDQSVKEQTANTLIYDVSSAYIEIIRYQNLVNVAQEQVSGFKDINQIAEKRSSLGASAYSDYSQSQVRLASAQSLLYDYTAQLMRWSAVLDNLANQSISKNIPWQFPSGMGNACESVDVRNFISPEISIAEAKVNVAKAQLEKVKADHYPTLSLAPTYQYRLDDNYNLYNKNRSRGDFGVFMNVSMQVMEGGAMNARTNEAEYALAAAKYNLDYERTRISQKILEASSQIKSISFSLQAQKNKVLSAVRTRDLYKQQYAELGTRQFSDLINAEAEIHQTKIEIINNQYNIQKLSIECLTNTGMLPSKLMN